MGCAAEVVSLVSSSSPCAMTSLLFLPRPVIHLVLLCPFPFYEITRRRTARDLLSRWILPTASAADRRRALSTTSSTCLTGRHRQIARSAWVTLPHPPSLPLRFPLPSSCVLKHLRPNFERPKARTPVARSNTAPTIPRALARGPRTKTACLHPSRRPPPLRKTHRSSSSSSKRSESGSGTAAPPPPFPPCPRSCTAAAPRGPPRTLRRPRKVLGCRAVSTTAATAAAAGTGAEVEAEVPPLSVVVVGRGRPSRCRA